MSEEKRRIDVLFVGAGAVGCFYASRCHAPSENVHVSLVCRSNYPAISAHGVTLHTRDFGNYHFAPTAVYPSIPAAASSESAPPRGWDYVVLSTKALPDVLDDAASIAPLVARDGGSGRTCVVLVQNGFGVEAPHRARFPANPLVSGVTVVSAEQTSPGVIRQNRWTRISLGAYTDGGHKSGGDGGDDPHDLVRRGAANAREFAALLARGGVRDAEAKPEVALQAVRWHKICINAAMNPSAVLSGGRGNADMAGDVELRRHLRGCMEEVFAAAPSVIGADLAAEGLAAPERILASTDRNKGGKPSMLLDWEAGRPMELEVILGNPVRVARERGVEMPRLQSLYALLKSAQVERERRKKEEEEGKEKAGVEKERGEKQAKI